jgi:hypothetical protein
MKSRWMRRPTPGQPFANVENSRCKTPLSCNRTALARAREALKGETGIILLGDQSSMIPRLSAMVTAWDRSLAPSLDIRLVTRLLMVASATNS